MPNDLLVPVYNALHEAGKEFKLRNIGFRALDILSAEKGYLHWHQDLRLGDTPLEAGLGYVCKLNTKTDFLGKQSLLDQKKKGLKKRLITFTIQSISPIPLWGQEPVYKDNNLVGFVRRAEYGFELQKTIGYGYVSDSNDSVTNKEFLTDGIWTVEAMLKRHPIKIHFKHPFDPKGLRMKK